MKTKALSFALVMSLLFAHSTIAADWFSRFVEKELRCHNGYMTSMGPILMNRLIQMTEADHKGIEGLETASLLNASLTCSGKEQRRKLQRLRQKAARHDYDIIENNSPERLELIMIRKEEGKFCQIFAVVCTPSNLSIMTLEGAMSLDEDVNKIIPKVEMTASTVAYNHNH